MGADGKTGLGYAVTQPNSEQRVRTGHRGAKSRERFGATRQGWSGGREAAEFLKSCLSSSGCKFRPVEAGPGGPGFGEWFVDCLVRGVEMSRPLLGRLVRLTEAPVGRDAGAGPYPARAATFAGVWFQAGFSGCGPRRAVTALARPLSPQNAPSPPRSPFSAGEWLTTSSASGGREGRVTNSAGKHDD